MFFSRRKVSDDVKLKSKLMVFFIITGLSVFGPRFFYK